MYLLFFVLGFYVLICVLLYLFQEKLLFFPQKLDKDFQFNFSQPFEERWIKVEDSIKLHGILFKSDSSKGLVFYLHGNGGAINSWGGVATTYTDLGYDVFIMDYRGYGKSEGVISSEKELYNDIDLVFNSIINEYNQKRKIIIGYSLGTGLAAYLSQSQSIDLLILQAPYYSMLDMVKLKYPFVPSFLLKFKLESNKYLLNSQSSIVIFHGKNDELIPCEASKRLFEENKEKAELILLDYQGHNDMTSHPDYKLKIEKLLF